MAASVVVLEERTGRRRRVELVGGALPLQGANWSGLQLMSTTWNPGNPEGTQQVLGPQEVPSTWDFVWNTTRIIRTPVTVTDPERGAEYTIYRAHQIANLLDDILRGGALLQVSWVASAATQSQASPRQVRLGRGAAWDFEIDRPDDITASITFEWVGRGASQPKVSDIRGENITASIQAAINAANAAADAVAQHVLRNPNRNRAPAANTFNLGQLEAMANAPIELADQFARQAQSFSNRLQQVGELINTTKETPAAITGRLLDVANNSIAVSNQFVDRLSREGPETQSTRMKVSALTRAATYFGSTQTQAQLMAETMEKLANVARRRQSALVSAAGSSRRGDRMRTEDVYKVHAPRADETMASISARYYGTPDLGNEIARANGLPAYTIKPPRIPLIIPTRRSIDSASRNKV